MIATGGAMAFLRRSTGMGLEQAIAEVDTEALAARIEDIKHHLQARRHRRCSSSQGVRMVRGTARFVSPYEVEVTGVEGTQRIPFDAALVSPARGRASRSGARPTATAS